MDVVLKSLSEQKAEQAQYRNAFSGLNLLHLKRRVAELLSLIGSAGIFDEYTIHDISHIEAMLYLLETVIIPKPTINIMSSADWLMLVLSVYFHDMGMLVTRHEYGQRDNSGYPQFRDAILFSNDAAEEERERFLYQEFVREHHADRISYWIEGTAPERLGITNATASAIEDLLAVLPSEFRDDLAMVAASHHRDDLKDIRKYKTAQRYGMSIDEEANLQYIAVLLRTADLLHITSDRTPSILFRVLSPADPLSQREWAKQRAVRALRAKPMRDEDGVLDPDRQADTFDVYATFTDEEGYFGLTTYLDYATKELRKSFNWIAQSQKTEQFKHEFPWRNIDQEQIEAKNFLKDKFEFTLDQDKILTLLTGHTLYNDTDVVLRELVQNAIDAVRLQFWDGTRDKSRAQGEVFIDWSSTERVLTVRDNGTGMTQEIIQANLLKVGASRYQEPQFRKDYPQFSPISSFGIGILSAFMLADDVEIFTVHEQEEKARRLLLRTVHGKYLIRLLDKSEPPIKEMGPHGTVVRLRLRPSAKNPDVRTIARRWIVIPECNVFVTVDDQRQERVGFDSPRDALLDALSRRGLLSTEETPKSLRKIKVEQWAYNGMTLAYATVWSEYFKEWEFLTSGGGYSNLEEEAPLLGTCVEGIRIEFGTPGYNGQPLWALVNATGASAPRTNVARSGLERTVESTNLLHQIYTGFCAHVSKEIQHLQTEQRFSLTRAADEAQYLLWPITQADARNPRAGQLNPDLLRECLADIPAIIIERNGQRLAATVNSLKESEDFWTVDCPFFKSVENLLRELPKNVSLRELGQFVEEGQFALPEGPLLCIKNRVGTFGELALQGREIAEVRIIPNESRLDLRWSKRGTPAIWIRPNTDWPPYNNRLGLFFDRFPSRAGFSRRTSLFTVEFANHDRVTLSGVKDEMAIDYGGKLSLFSTAPIVDFLRHCAESTDKGGAWLVVSFIATAISADLEKAVDVESFFNGRFLPEARYHIQLDDLVDLDAFRRAIRESSWNVFTTSRWRRPPSEQIY